MLLSIIAYGAVAASATARAVIGSRIDKSPNAPSRAALWASAGILATIALAIHAFLWLRPLDPVAFERDFDRNIRRVPFAWVLVRDDADFHRQVLEATKAAFREGGWPGAERALMRLVDARLPRAAAAALQADDARILAYGASLLPVLRRLQDEPQSCRALLRYQHWPPYPIAHAEVATAALAFADAYRAAARPDAASAWHALRAEAEAEALVARLSLGPTPIPPAEQRALREPTLAADATLCAGMIKLYENALSLPPSDAAAATRLILWSIASGKWADMRDVAYGGDRREPLDFRIEFDVARSASLVWLLWLFPLVLVPLIAFLLIAPSLPRRLVALTFRQRGLRRLVVGCSGAIVFMSLWELGWTHADRAALLAAWQAGDYRTVEGVVRNYHALADDDASFEVGDKWFQLSDRFVTSGYNYAVWRGGRIHDGNYVRIAYVARAYRDPFSLFIRHYTGNTILRWADAEKMFGPGYGTGSLTGPGKSKGAVIWSDGSDTRDRTVEIAEDEPPDLAASFRAAGWDVFKLDRLIDDNAGRYDALVIADAARRLKYQGYARIVLMGQSAGAWLSLLAAGESDDIDAVIANAPAFYGHGRRKSYNASELYKLLERIRHARVMLSFFRDDEYDPGGRAEPAAGILARRGVDHLIIDGPTELPGHGSGSSGLFARRFAGCALALAGSGPIPPLARCRNASWGLAPSKELVVPAVLRGELPRPGGTPLDRYLGRWYGYFRSGQEILFAVVKRDGATLTAAYTIGPPIGSTSDGRVVLREGVLRDTGLVLESKTRATLTLTLQRDGRLEATWTSAAGASTWHATLRRLAERQTATARR